MSSANRTPKDLVDGFLAKQSATNPWEAAQKPRKTPLRSVGWAKYVADGNYKKTTNEYYTTLAWLAQYSAPKDASDDQLVALQGEIQTMIDDGYDLMFSTKGAINEELMRIFFNNKITEPSRQAIISNLLYAPNIIDTHAEVTLRTILAGDNGTDKDLKFSHARLLDRMDEELRTKYGYKAQEEEQQNDPEGDQQEEKEDEEGKPDSEDQDNNQQGSSNGNNSERRAQNNVVVTNAVIIVKGGEKLELKGMGLSEKQIDLLQRQNNGAVDHVVTSRLGRNQTTIKTHRFTLPDGSVIFPAGKKRGETRKVGATITDYKAGAVKSNESTMTMRGGVEEVTDVTFKKDGEEQSKKQFVYKENQQIIDGLPVLPKVESKQKTVLTANACSIKTWTNLHLSLKKHLMYQYLNRDLDNTTERIKSLLKDKEAAKAQNKKGVTIVRGKLERTTVYVEGGVEHKVALLFIVGYSRILPENDINSKRDIIVVGDIPILGAGMVTQVLADGPKFNRFNNALKINISELITKLRVKFDQEPTWDKRIISDFSIGYLFQKDIVKSYTPNQVERTTMHLAVVGDCLNLHLASKGKGWDTATDLTRTAYQELRAGDSYNKLYEFLRKVNSVGLSYGLTMSDKDVAAADYISRAFGDAIGDNFSRKLVDVIAANLSDVSITVG